MNSVFSYNERGMNAGHRSHSIAVELEKIKIMQVASFSVGANLSPSLVIRTMLSESDFKSASSHVRLNTPQA